MWQAVGDFASCLPALIQPVLQQVYEDEQAHPDHVHKVPVPGCRFEAKMIIRLEVSLDGTSQHDSQHESTQCHVKAVEACQQEER